MRKKKRKKIEIQARSPGLTLNLWGVKIDTYEQRNFTIYGACCSLVLVLFFRLFSEGGVQIGKNEKNKMIYPMFEDETKPTRDG